MQIIINPFNFPAPVTVVNFTFPSDTQGFAKYNNSLNSVTGGGGLLGMQLSDGGVNGFFYTGQARTPTSYQLYSNHIYKLSGYYSNLTAGINSSTYIQISNGTQTFETPNGTDTSAGTHLLTTTFTCTSSGLYYFSTNWLYTWKGSVHTMDYSNILLQKIF